MNPRYLAPIILISANLFFTGSFSLVKYLSTNVPVHTIMLIRFLAGPIYLGPFFLLKKKRISVTNWPYFLMRVIFGVCAMTCLFLAFKYGELAKSTLIFELGVIWTLLYGWWRTGTTPHRYTLAAIPLAFIGIWAVLQPEEWTQFQIGDGFAFLGSLLNTGVFVSIKELRHDHDTSTVVLVSYILSAAILVIPNLTSMPTLSMPSFAGLALMSSIGLCGQIGMVMGFKYASAGISSLMMVSIIPFTAISGFFLFNEQVNALAWCGILMVISALAIIGRWQ